MKLPEIKRNIFKVVVDDVEIELSEPTLPQLSRLAEFQDIGKTKDTDKMIKEISAVLVSLMDNYEATQSEKQEFVNRLSLRQIMDIVNGLVSNLEESSKKKVMESNS